MKPVCASSLSRCDLLGKGAYGKVNAAHVAGYDEKLALKCSDHRSEISSSRALREAVLQKKCFHPRIMEVFS